MGHIFTPAVLVISLLCVAGVPWIWILVSHSFGIFDDVGFYLSSIQQLPRGLYLHDMGPYGPAYYVLVSATFSTLRLSISQDGSEIITTAWWAILLAMATIGSYRITRSLIAAGCVWMTVLLGSQEFSIVPLYPGLLLLIITALLIATVLWIQPAHRRFGSALLGLLLATATLTKLNLGVFDACALVTLYGLLAPTSAPWRHWVTTLVYLLPFSVLILFAPQLGSGWAQEYAITTISAFAAFLIPLISWRTSGDTRILWPDSRYLLAASGAGAILFCVPILATGVSMLTLVSGMLTTVFDLRNYFTLPLVMPWPSEVIALVCLIGGILFRKTLGKYPPHTWSPRRRFEIFALLVAPVAILIVASGGQPSTTTFALLPLVGLVAAYAALTTSKEPGLEKFSAIVTIASFTLWDQLQAYPVAGEQVATGALLVLPLLIISAWSVLPSVTTNTQRVMRAGTLAVIVAASGVYCIAEKPLAFPGFESVGLTGNVYLYLPAQSVEAIHSIRDVARASCSSLFTIPGMDSFNFWTGLPSPDPGLNTDDNLIVLTTQQQRSVTNRLADSPSACVLYSPTLVSFWIAGRQVKSGPLATYVTSHYAIIASANGYQLLKRN